MTQSDHQEVHTRKVLFWISGTIPKIYKCPCSTFMRSGSEWKIYATNIWSRIKKKNRASNMSPSWFPYWMCLSATDSILFDNERITVKLYWIFQDSGYVSSLPGRVNLLDQLNVCPTLIPRFFWWLQNAEKQKKKVEIRLIMQQTKLQSY